MHRLQTGDIILFSGKCSVSRLIRLLTWSKWSHVGMIINDDPNHPFPLLFESTHNDTVKDLDTGKYVQGVQVVSFEDRLHNYRGTVAIRRVQNPCYKNRHQLRLYRTEVQGTPFEQNWMEILASAYLFRWLRTDTEDLSSIFCSEHHAEATMALGWLPRTKPSNHYDPKFFSKNTIFRNGVSYTAIEILKK